MANYKQADVQRGIRAAKREGLSISGYEVMPDGSIKFTIAETHTELENNDRNNSDWRGLEEL